MAHEQLVEVFGEEQVIRVPEANVAHEASRRWLAEVGVVRRAGVIRLDPDPPGGLHTAGSCFRHPEKLPDGVADLLVIGRLVIAGEECERVLLDPGSGRISVCYFFVQDDACTDLELLASDLSTLTRLSAAVEELRTERGEFARFAGRYGAEAVAQLTDALLTMFRSYDPEVLRSDRRTNALWRIAAHVRPMARIAGPGQGLALDLPEGLLVQAFGEDDVIRVDDDALPATLTHEPTRRFLKEHGLPWDGGNFMAERELPLRTLRQEWSEGDDEADVPPNAECLTVLGYLVDDIDLVVDGSTGLVSGWYGPDEKLRPVNADVSTLAFTCWLWNRERLLDKSHGFTVSYAELAHTMTEILSSVDPVVCRPTGEDDDFRYWPEVLADEGGGVL